MTVHDALALIITIGVIGGIIAILLTEVVLKALILLVTGGAFVAGVVGAVICFIKIFTDGEGLMIFATFGCVFVAAMGFTGFTQFRQYEDR